MVPRVQEIMSLSDQETKLLVTTANAYVTEARHQPSHVPVVFEARMEEIESGHVSEPVSRQLNDLEQKRIAAVMGYVQRLKSGFGAERFQLFDDYVRSSKWETALIGRLEPR